MKFRSLSLLLICAGATSLAQAAGQNSSSPAAASPAAIAAAPVAEESIIKSDTVVGTGAVAGLGSTVEVHYTGWLYKPMAPRQRGREFDSSLPRRETFKFLLGARQVIKGWDIGVEGMKVGGKRTIIIPAPLAYGSRGSGDNIPPNADLIFDVELLDVK